ncbi:MAG: repressor LexA [Candidatus Omnitrophica bacterium]|nr:repressor LexA [Candidatus Omnitrophota bacterium]
MKSKLTKKQKRFLNELANYIDREGRSPTFRELQEIMQLRSPRTVSQYLEYLEEAGFVRRGKGARNIQVLRNLPNPEVNARTIKVPIVGSVACGLPLLAEQNIDDYVSVSEKIAKAPYSYFVLRAKGDSMNGAGISDGDLILIRQQPVADNGQDIVALIDDEATIKRLCISNDYIILNPVSNNKEHNPIFLERDFQVQGVVVKILGRKNDVDQ